MHDFKCADPNEMNYSELRKRTAIFKDENKEVIEMCEIWEEVRREGIDEGIEMMRNEVEKAQAAKEKAEAEAKAAQARAEAQAKAQAEAMAAQARAEAQAEAEAEAKERATKNAIRMIKRGNLTTEEIAEYTGLSEDQVMEYAALIAS